MSPATLQLVRQNRSLGAAEDLDYGITLLSAARSGALPPTLRIYRPQPTVAFGQRDTHRPGFQEAAAACREQGFVPLVRKAGGRAAAYHRGCLIIDHIEPAADAIAQTKQRFSAFGRLLARALQNVGVDAAVGEIAGEYCAGEFSIHGVPAVRNAANGRPAEHSAAGAVKLVGTAQRVVSGAWLFSSVVVVQDSAPLRTILTSAYGALGLDWNPATAGAAEDLVPGLEVRKVEGAILAAYAQDAQLQNRPFDELTAQLPN